MPDATIHSLPADIANAMKSTGVWQEASPVPLERLSLVPVRYIDFQGTEHSDGQIIVLDAVAAQIAQIFSALYEMRFPIHKVSPAHNYGGDDELSMADNNTFSYCFRPIAGSTALSLHAYGLAVDINPLQNPFVQFDELNGTATIHPRNGWEYLNRHNRKRGMVEDIAPLLAEHGFFIWGGRWTTPIDYHHFQMQRGIAELLLALCPEDGKTFIESAINHRDKLKTLTSMPSGERIQPLIELYRKNKSDFFERWTEYIA